MSRDDSTDPLVAAINRQTRAIEELTEFAKTVIDRHYNKCRICDGRGYFRAYDLGNKIDTLTCSACDGKGVSTPTEEKSNEP